MGKFMQKLCRISTEKIRQFRQNTARELWKNEGSISVSFIPGKLNPADALTKPLGWMLHNRHARQLMGHFTGITACTDDHNLPSVDTRLGEGVSGTDTPESPNPIVDTGHPDIVHF